MLGFARGSGAAIKCRAAIQFRAITPLAIHQPQELGFVKVTVFGEVGD
jgi:hypothetical protein